jgi:prepilin-type N-terminal cleavage/methylation domain-containing protein
MFQRYSVSPLQAKLRLSPIHRILRSHLITSRTSRQGFTIIEVLVALMVAMIFITVTLQMFVAAAYFRSKGDQYNQAFNWIQEDYETVFNRASEYENNVEPASTLCAATNPANGLAANFVSDATRGLGGATTTIGPRTFSGRLFLLTRTGDYTNSANPYKLLKLNYTVTEANGGAAIANINTEVAIYAGFKCP